MTEVTIGDIRMVNTDCLELMRSMADKSVDFILTDIPYELHQHGGGVKGDFSNRKMINNIDRSLAFISNGIDYDVIFSEFERLCKVVNCCIFCSNKQVGKIMTWWEKKGYVATLLVWDKPNPIPLCNSKYISNLEFIVYVRDKGATFNNIGYNYQLKTFRYQAPVERIHETEKPVELLRHLLLLHTKESDLVFDAYAGSFTTAVACFKEKRRFLGSEILAKYFDPSVERMKRLTSQLSLF